jgi:hypothetical protein
LHEACTIVEGGIGFLEEVVLEAMGLKHDAHLQNRAMLR